MKWQTFNVWTNFRISCCRHTTILVSPNSIHLLLFVNWKVDWSISCFYVHLIHTTAPWKQVIEIGILTREENGRPRRNNTQRVACKLILFSKAKNKIHLSLMSVVWLHDTTEKENIYMNTNESQNHRFVVPCIKFIRKIF